jgi:hypothetical protein
MGQSQASTPVWRYNVRMATEARCQAGKTPRAPTGPTNDGHTLAPEELAEFMDSLEYDAPPPLPADSANYDPEYND